MAESRRPGDDSDRLSGASRAPLPTGAQVRAAALLAGVALAILLPAPAPRAEADEPAPAPAVAAAVARGPSFGTNRYRTEIRHGARIDVDDYVSALLAGETLSVRVEARGDSPLRPALTVLDPSGEDRTPTLVAREDGRAASFRALPIDRSGRWTVRVGGRSATEGAYEVSFRVTPPPVLRFLRQSVGGAAGPSRDHAFEGVGGATLLARVRARAGSRAPDLESVVDPDERSVPLERSGRGRRDRGAAWRVPLAGGDGAWRATFGVEEGEGRYDVSLRVRPPGRPHGTRSLVPSEPRLPVFAHPLEGGPKRTVTLTGGGFSVDPPPEVWFGASPARVVEGTAYSLQVLPPPLPLGTVADVTVVNPDGQACVRESHFLYASPAPPRVGSLAPASCSVWVGTTREFTVRLTDSPGYPAVAVGLTTTGGIGTVDATALIAGNTDSARFRFTAASAPAAGTIVATLGDSSAVAHVTVLPLPGEPEPPPPPDEIDLSGWTLRQANSSRTFTFPAGTRLTAPATVVVGRASSKANFQAYWDAVWTDEVTYLTADPANSSSTSDDWPSINGGETYELRDASGAVVDGPTAAMGDLGGQVLQRIPGTPAGAASSWTVHELPYSWATPGRVPAETDGGKEHGVWISEFSDVLGSGNFVYEFVEIRFDGLPDGP